MQILNSNGHYQSPLFELPEQDDSKPKIDFAFQEIGVRIENEFGKDYKRQIWPLFYNAKYNKEKIELAFIAYKKQTRVKSFRYFLGILNNL